MRESWRIQGFIEKEATFAILQFLTASLSCLKNQLRREREADGMAVPAEV